MSKKKHVRSHHTATAKQNHTPTIRQEFGRARTLLTQHRLPEAIALLEALHQRFPQEADVLSVLASAYQDMGDRNRVAQTLERYIQVAPTASDVAVALLAIGSAFLSVHHPALVIRAYRRFVAQFPDHAEAPQLRKALAELESLVLQDLEQTGVQVSDPLDFAARHEEAQVALDCGDYPTARRIEQELVRQFPAFVSGMNNISLTYALEDNLQQAMEIAQQVLAIDAENVHALANLIRYHMLLGQRDEAALLAVRLKRTASLLRDAWVKQVEALTYLQDDAGVWVIYQNATKRGFTKGADAQPFGLHLAAVAAYHLGHERKARSLWQQAVQNDPTFDLASDNMEDLAHPIAERHAPWPFALNQWLLPHTIRDLRAKVEALTKQYNDGRADRELRAFAERHPDLLQSIPLLLANGDPIGRSLALHVAFAIPTAPIYAVLQEYGASRHGPDGMRLSALNHLTESGIAHGQTRLWLNGEWTDVTLNSYEITNEPEEYSSDEVNNLFVEALDTLHADDGVTAESVLREALEFVPNDPRLVHNLTVALEMQDRHQEAMELLATNFARNPDYFFARIGVASVALKEDRITDAEELIKPLLARKKFHTSQFEAFVEFQVHLAIKKELPEMATSWLEVWEDMLPDSPKLPRWRTTVDIFTFTSRLRALQSRSRKRKPKELKP